MKEIVLDAEPDAVTYVRTACRGFVEQEKKILISREKRGNIWLLPGGGLEEGETLAACCERELLEETGFLVAPFEPLFSVTEFFGTKKYISYYFSCRIIGEGEKHLTEGEQACGLETFWSPIKDYRTVLESYPSFPRENVRFGVYRRDLAALKEYLTQKEERD